MSDFGHDETDKELKQLEARISAEYKVAAADLELKMNKYLSDFARKDEMMKKDMQAGKMSENDYLIWRRNQIIIGKRWETMLDSVTKDMVNADKLAASMINKSLPNVYAQNMNYGTYEVESGTRVDTGFTLYDRSTVENLLKEDPHIIKFAKIDEEKDERWNKKKIESAVLQGILQGESMPKIASRLKSVANMGDNAAIRNARTYTTAAENKGRMDSYERCQEMGIKMKKKWIATLDDRTRVEHRHLDEMVADIDEPFKTDGYEIMYPGDPEAEGEMIYNCRCTLVSEIPGIMYDDKRYDEKLGDMTYEEWKHAKDRQPKEEVKEEKTEVSKKRVVIDGKDISQEWERRSEFDFEINDVINAQGFDGLPKIVSAEEFDEAVKESNFVAQRTYSAPDKETGDGYRDMLYNGEWYVDCSVGGAQYGQGMYCAANYSGRLDEGIKIEMETYQNGTMGRMWRDMDDEDRQKVIGFQKEMMKVDEELYGDPPKVFMTKFPELVEENTGISVPRNYIETLTVDPSAKIVKYDDIVKEKNNDSEKFKDMDVGVYAVLKGYDGINAEGHGESGSYTVILNRTKLIIKGE